MHLLSSILLFFTFVSYAAFAKLTFKKDFQFGAATGAYLVEGGWNLDGKTPNIWDHWLHENPSIVKDGTNGDVAADSYHKYKKDIRALKEIGSQFYRFSIQWTRILPSGYNNQINQAGVDYYNKLINGLLKNNIEPVVTMYHWDLPQALQDRGGFENELLVKWFRDYAEVLFDTFGDRVKTWITFNEAYEICAGGYGLGTYAPGFNYSGIADYQCARVLLLAHAEVYHLYQEKYQKSQKGKIGITVQVNWVEPKTNSQADKDATDRALEFLVGWFLHPICSVTGNWPKIMRDRVADNSKAEGYKSSRLPPFSAAEIKRIKKTFDFIGLDHYTTYLISNYRGPKQPVGFPKDAGYLQHTNPKFKTTILDWLQIAPGGIRKAMNWVSEKYNNPTIYVTENGFANSGDLDDQDRIDYLEDYLRELWKATYEDKNNIQRYTVWGLIDKMEWRDGYVPRFGLYNVDFNSAGKKRTARKSAKWYKNVIKTRKV